MVVIQMVQRWMNFAIANPARQVFFTVVAREEKYKAKNLIDVVIYRGSDALYGWVFDSLQALGLKIGAIALCALPVAAGWLVLSAALGRAQERRAARAGRGGSAGRLRMIRHDPAANLPRSAGAALVARKALAQSAAAPLIARAIPSSGERLPAVGLGTAQVFDSDDERTRHDAAQVVAALVDGGGRVIDTASSYGEAESVLGNVIARAALARQALHRHQARGARRSGTEALAGPAGDGEGRPPAAPQCARSASNPWRSSRNGRRKACAATSASPRPSTAISPRSRRCSHASSRISCRSIIRSTTAKRRSASCRWRPRSRPAVLTALPFGRGRLFRAVHGKAIPDWATGFAGSWAQFFLKYLLGDQRVTAVIPGTSDPAHMADNLGAMRGALPDPDQRKRMVAFIDGL